MNFELLITNIKTRLSKLLSTAKLSKRDLSKTVRFYRNTGYKVEAV